MDYGIKKAVGGNVQHLKASFHLGFHKVGSSLESLIGIFVENGGVMFLRIFAAFNQEHHETEELRVGVIGVIDMSRRLSSG